MGDRMTIRIICKISLLTLFLSFSIFLDSGVAESFPYRNFALGDVVPDGVIVNSEDQSTFSLHDLKGQPAILLFWGGDLEAKKKRAVTALTELQNLKGFFAEKNVTVTVINDQGDSNDVITEVREASGLTYPIYVDPDQKLYGTLGLYIMPAVLLIDKDGRAVAGMGYSKDMTAILKGEVEILMGEKTRAELEAQLHPVMVEKSKDEVLANRHLNMGYVLSRKGQIEEAQREFKNALVTEPKLAAAHIELGCNYFTLGDVEEAAKALDIGLDLDPDSLRGEICYAQVLAAEGEIDGALEDLQTMLFHNGRNAELHYVLGTLYSQKGVYDKAAKEYRKAYELLLRKTHLSE
jgi:tetratricopeptide (TPR) repeat protein